MNKTKDLEYRNEYVQSANSLFHFMQQRDYLISALERRALVPRYCFENVEYLRLLNGKNKLIHEIAVLQKCFCDIQLHKIEERCEIVYHGLDDSPEEDGSYNVKNYETHTSCYGKFALGFSKGWGLKNGLQPVIYVSEDSGYIENFKSMFEYAINKDVEDCIIDDVIGRLAISKPLKGIMKRSVSGRTIEIEKNFHDEKEWRYIPKDEQLRALNKEKIIAKGIIRENLLAINGSLETKKNDSIWLHFDYQDIKYIIVPDRFERRRLIEFIQGMPDERFGSDIQKSELISCIFVLDDIRRDC